MSRDQDATDNAGLTVTPFQSFLGWRVLRWEAGLCELVLDLEPQHLNRTGVVHGGVVMTLLDTASGLAAGHRTDATQPQPTVTISLTCNFIASAAAGRLTALGRVEGGGGRVLSTSASLRDGNGRLLATAVGSFRRFATPRGETALTPQ